MAEVTQKISFISQLLMSSSVFKYKLPFLRVWVFYLEGRGEFGFGVGFGWLVDMFSCGFFFMCSICILIMISASLRLSFPAYVSTRHIKNLGYKEVKLQLLYLEPQQLLWLSSMLL